MHTKYNIHAYIDMSTSPLMLSSHTGTKYVWMLYERSFRLKASPGMLRRAVRHTEYDTRQTMRMRPHARDRVVSNAPSTPSKCGSKLSVQRNVVRLDCSRWPMLLHRMLTNKDGMLRQDTVDKAWLRFTLRGLRLLFENLGHNRRLFLVGCAASSTTPPLLHTATVTSSLTVLGRAGATRPLWTPGASRLAPLLLFGCTLPFQLLLWNAKTKQRHAWHVRQEGAWQYPIAPQPSKFWASHT